MERCNVEIIGLDALAGMGRIDAASDASDYAPFTVLEPGLRSSGAAWMNQFREVPQYRGGEIWIDPVRVIVDGDGGFYATGPVRLSTGGIRTPGPVPDPPTFSLPPLDP